jgi:multiple sugar transport system substrate-binding protein
MQPIKFVCLGSLALLGASLLGAGSAKQVTLHVFVGGQERPNVMKQLFKMYEQSHPGVTVKLQVGGATSNVQQSYLTTVLSSHDSSIDVLLLDIIRPAQYAAAGWAVNLNRFMTPAQKSKLLSQYLPVYSHADQVSGKLMALPAFADAQFLYYRKDLLKKFGFQPPKTWGQLLHEAKVILAKEHKTNPYLQGLLTAGAPIEGTVCTFLVPFWGAGGTLVNSHNQVQVDTPAGKKAMNFWLTAMKEGVVPSNIAGVVTDGMRRQFQNGDAIFEQQWSYAWNHFQSSSSKVRGKVGVVPLPSFAGGKPATCIGGWQWAVSSYSNHPNASYKLIRYLSSPPASKFLAIHASNLPVFPDLYTNPAILKVDPWFKEALPVVLTARSRPISPLYPKISEILRDDMNAVLAGTMSADAALKDMQSRLQAVYDQSAAH